METVKPVSIICTCEYCPTQYEIKLSDGRELYFRYRWENLSITLVNEENCGRVELVSETIDDLNPGPEAYYWIGVAVERLNNGNL